jgi:hypothetical protein
MTSTQLERSEVTNKGIFATWWWLVLVGVVVGGVMGAAQLLGGGSPAQALVDVAIVAGYTAVLAAFRSRSETASILSGDSVDERWQSINLHALAAAGLIAAFVALGGSVVAQATGRDWSGFAIMAGTIGIAYIGGVIWYRWRS